MEGLKSLCYLILFLQTFCYAWVSHKDPCYDSLVTDSTAVPDSSFSALSELMQDGTYSAARARMDNKYEIPWKAGSLDRNQYIQVDLGVATLISAIQTQGCGIIGMCKEWVTKFRFLYSLDGKHWRTYVDSTTGRIIEFNGNIDSHKIVENSLSCPVIARYIRVMPSSWNNYISMKIDLRGCALNHAYVSPKNNGTSVTSSTQSPLFHKPHLNTAGAKNNTSVPQPAQSLTITTSGGKPNDNGCLGGLGKFSCWGIADGDYQHCVSCRKFIKCSNYNIFEFVCPSKLLWDDRIKQCSFMSNTCSVSI